MSKTLQEILDTDLSPDNIKNMAVDELYDYIIDAGIVNSVKDINMLIVEGIQRAVNEDDEFPIKYYNKDEEMPEESKTVSNPGPMLTDGYVSGMKSGN